MVFNIKDDICESLKQMESKENLKLFGYTLQISSSDKALIAHCLSIQLYNLGYRKIEWAGKEVR